MEKFEKDKEKPKSQAQKEEGEPLGSPSSFCE
jgi:hypothetical protein